MSNRIEFQFNAQKALEVILWLATKKPNIGYHALLKTLFFAEEYHLNHYGRTIVGDVYLAMDYGPVASTTYDLLKQEALAVELLDEDLPFENVHKKITPLRKPDLRKLSPSDIEALEYAVSQYGHYDFKRLTDITHQHPAWKKAREHDEHNPRMDYKDFLKESDDEIIQDLIDNSKLMRL
ncbi:MAG: hypothetical protein DRR08_16485 [Candidatus Parabeggiatoa sp. nov. 2]|nr:MAG: hypothetical protein B6247_21165 [Beggiatoa sp. 4572_84]RKZ58401.1 MAG: hypothetical protein DRR08_16485 [Gammaproteobacteria bacterium]